MNENYKDKNVTDLFETLLNNKKDEVVLNIFEKMLDNKDVTAEEIANTIKSQAVGKRIDNNRPLSISEQKAKQEAQKNEKEARIKQATCMDLPIGFENPYNTDNRAQGVYFDNCADALVYCYRNLGRVDIEYIAKITNNDYKTVIQALKGSIFQNPQTWQECFYKGWENADEYLCGNIIQKYGIAKKANGVYKNWFSDNLTAIKSILPEKVLSDDIYIHPASPWVPKEIHDEFIQYLFGKPTRPYSFDSTVKHDEKTGTWDIPAKSVYKVNPDTYSKYGTRRLDALEIYEKTLNGSTIKIYDEVFDYVNNKKVRVLNQSETLLAVEKQKLIVKIFQEWAFKEKERKRKLQIAFAEKYGYYRTRRFDGSFLQLPGLNPDIQLYKYQKDAVARIIFSSNTLLAHDVGSGKTYEMVVAGMELKRMGLSKKNLYVVPNNILSQWYNIFQLLYKNANVLCVDPKDFTPAKRDETLYKIRDNDYDAVIMPYSIFDKIPVSKKWVCEKFLAEEEELKEYAKKWSKNTSGIRHAQKKLKPETKKLLDKIKKFEMALSFDELGFTRLFVDEAHNYKNVPVDSRSMGIRGINDVGSLKCEMMLEKVRYIQKINNGGGVVMATGTPLTNSLTDAFVIQNYLQHGELKIFGLHNFDAWVGMFAEPVTDFEIDVDTNTYRLATRLSEFHNMTEFTNIFSSIADFHVMDSSEGLPQFNGYIDHLIPQTHELKLYLEDISRRADDIHNRRVSRKEDNMLLLTVDGRKAALDMRLVKTELDVDKNSKVFVCAEEVFKIYQQTMDQKSTQLVFCDSSTPGDKFNLYHELTKILIEKGVPYSKIAYIHDAKTEKQREKLFLAVRNGDVRILIGSTLKLGTGVNVQDKLIAIHHLDVPWRPSDMVQRQGRILRQGNTNPEVFIHRYITKGSFDAYSWQLLEVKQRFINEILSGSTVTKTAKDIDDTVLDYAEVKALAVGNPLIKQRVEVANDLSRLKTLQRKAREEKEQLRKELLEVPGQRAYYTSRIDETKNDVEFVETFIEKMDVEARKEFRVKLIEALANNVLEVDERSLGYYRGFEIILPSNMTKGESYVFVKRRGCYKVEMGGTEKGNLVRIDNCIDGLKARLSRFYDRLYEIRMRETSIQAQLEKDENFAQEIEECEKRLAKIDKKLGVNKDV